MDADFRIVNRVQVPIRRAEQLRPDNKNRTGRRVRFKRKV